MKQVLGIIFLIVVAVAVFSGDGDDSNDANQAAAVEEQSAPEADPDLITLVDPSYCQADPFEARLLVHVTLRNDDTEDATIDLRPWRRYSDASVNDSFLDTMLDLAIPAGSSKSFYGEFDYNAEEHSLIECGVYMPGDVEPTEVEVR